MCFTFLIKQYADPQENNRSYFRFVLYITQIRSGLFFGRFEGNSILTKNAETRILLQNSILSLSQLVFPAPLCKFVLQKLFCNV